MKGFIDQEVVKQSSEFSKSGKIIRPVGFDKQKPFKHSIIADAQNEFSGPSHTNPQFNPLIKR